MRAEDWSLWKDRWFIALTAVMALVVVGGVWAVIHNTDGSWLVPAIERGAALVAAVGVILTVYVMVAQTHASLRATTAWRKQDAEAAVLAETFRLIEKWDDPHFLSARTLNRRVGKAINKTNAIQLLEEIDRNDELETSVALVMNYFELLRLSIEQGRADEAFLKRQIGPISREIIKRFQPWIDKKDDVYKVDIEKFHKMMMP